MELPMSDESTGFRDTKGCPVEEIGIFIKPLKNLAKTVQAKLGGVACFFIKNGAIISSGINHNPTGGPLEDEIETVENGKTVRKIITRPEVVHAEITAIKAARQNGVDLTGSTLFLTMSPCIACAREIAKTGISDLCYLYEWWDKASLDLLRENGINTRQIAQKEEK
jgi:dCMP deaminase